MLNKNQKYLLFIAICAASGYDIFVNNAKVLKLLVGYITTYGIFDTCIKDILFENEKKPSRKNHVVDFAKESTIYKTAE